MGDFFVFEVGYFLDWVIFVYDYVEGIILIIFGVINDGKWYGIGDVDGEVGWFW